MTQHRVYCELEDLLKLRFQGNKLSLRFDMHKLEKSAGGHLSRLRGRGLEFAEHRIYQAGDDIRALDWKVTAKRSRPYTKIFHEEIERPILLIVDQGTSMFFGSQFRFKSTQAADTAALLFWSALKENDRVGGLVLGAKPFPFLKPVRQQKQALKLLDHLVENNQALNATLPESPEDRLTVALQQAKRVARPGTLCFILSDFHFINEASRAVLLDLNRHLQTVAIQIFDPLEKGLPSGRFAISNGTDRFQLDLTGSTSTPVNERLAEHVSAVPALLAKAGTACIPLSTWDAPFYALSRLTQGRGRAPQ